MKVNDENSRIRSGFESGSISQRHGSADPDPHPNVMDPEHWYKIGLQQDFKSFSGFLRKYVFRIPYVVDHFSALIFKKSGRSFVKQVGSQNIFKFCYSF